MTRAGLYLFLAAIVMRGLYWLQAGANPTLYIPQVDEAFYLEQARALIADGWLSGGFYMDPLYGWLAGVLLTLGDGSNPTPLRIAQLLLDSTSAVLIYLIGTRLAGSRVGLLAGALYVLYPIAWFYSLTLLKTTATTWATLTITWAALVGVDERRRWLHWTLLGLACGLAIYLRGNLLLLVPLTVMTVAWLQWSHGRSLAPVAVYLAAALVVPLAVGALHQLHSGQFRALPSAAGTTLYTANHPENRFGVHQPPPFVRHRHPAAIEREYQAEAEKRAGRSLSTSEASNYWRDQAMRHWFSAPDVLPTLAWYKLNQLITSQEIPNSQSVRIAAGFAPMLLPAVPVFTLALAAGVPGLLLLISHRREALVLLIPVTMVVLTTLLYFTTSRLRFPLVPPLLLGTAFLLIGQWNRRRLGVPTAMGAALIAALSLAAWAPTQDPDSAHLNLALAHAKLGEREQAAKQLAMIDPNKLDPARYLETRAFIALIERDFATTLRLGTRALMLEPDNQALLYNTARAALELGDEATAIALLERALSQAPDTKSEALLRQARERSR